MATASSPEENKKQQQSMNKELLDWLHQQRQDIQSLMQQSSEKTEQQPHDNCEICGEKKAKLVCLKCGRSVCTSCSFKILRICKKCVPKDIAERWDGTNPDWEKILGVEWVD
jgi:hypothetical protein